MPHVEQRFRVPASRSDVWNKLTAFADMPRWRQLRSAAQR